MSVDSDQWSTLPIGEPARRALRNAGYRTLTDLTKVTRTELAALHGMGPKALGILQAELNECGADFARP